jgi:DNA-binding GntR family transcriptional regulator
MSLSIAATKACASAAQSFKKMFGDRMRGWTLALPSDAAQREHSLDNLKWLFESLLNNDAVTAAHAMELHLARVQRTPRCTRPPPLLAFPASFLFYYGRLEGPD